MTRIAIVMVPFIKADLHRSLAEECLASIRSRHELDRIAIVNSTRSDDDNRWIKNNFDYIEHNDVNILARAWNRGIKAALTRGAELVVISNLDIVFHPLCLDNLLECSFAEPDAVVWSAVPWRDRATFSHAQLLPDTVPGVTWSCFSINKRLIDKVGLFDEGYIPAYREDSDMNYRIRIADLKTVSCRASLFFNYDRGTMKGLFGCAPEQVQDAAAMLSNLRANITRNDQRYIRKWGGLDGKECFKTPFNLKTAVEEDENSTDG